MSGHSKQNVQYRKNTRLAKRRKRRKRFIRRLVFFGIIVALIGLGIHYIMNSQFLLDRNNGGILDSKLKSTSQDEVNILVCGTDSDSDVSGVVEREGSASLTDTILYINWDLKENKVKVLQIPRDTYVGNVTYTGKINAIYNNQYDESIKGISGLATQINKMFSLPVDYYATITMDGFREIVDAIGGVEMNVPQRIDLEGVVLEEGLQRLDGTSAEKFMRYRSGYNDGDMGRVQAQRLFFSAFLQKLLTLGKAELAGLLPEIQKYVTTDLTINKALEFLDKGVELSTENLEFFLVPGESVNSYTDVPCYYELGGQSVYGIHLQATAVMLNNNFRPYSDPVAAESLGCIEIANTDTSYDNTDTNAESLLNSR